MYRNPEDLNRKLYVSNLPWNLTLTQFWNLCKAYGGVEWVDIKTQAVDGKVRSRGFGFVQFWSAVDADRAMHYMQGQIVGDRSLAVQRALPKEATKFHQLGHRRKHRFVSAKE